MQSGKSYFNGTLFRKNLARFWPVWALYALCWSFVLVAPPLLDGRRYWTLLSANRVPIEVLSNLGMLSAVVFSVLSAMCVFSYLYSSRPVGMLHSLPIRREGLFLTNYLSGLAFLVLPNIAIFLLSLGAEAVAGAAHVGALCMWLAVQSFLCLFFYSLAVFCGMFTGHILALPVFYGVLNGLVVALVSLFQTLAQTFLYGFSNVDTLYRAALWFTPVAKLVDAMSVRPNYAETGDAIARYNPISYSFEGLHIVLFYAIIGLILAALALVLYRRRQLERAGDIVSVGWVRPVFRYGVGLCAGITLGLGTYFLLFSGALGTSDWVLILLMLLWGAIGYFVAEMLLQKSFWVFRKRFAGCIVLLACMLAGTAVLTLDLTGYEGRIPPATRIESAFLSGPNSYPSDDASYLHLDTSTPEEVEEIRALHAAIIREQPLYQDYQRNRWSVSNTAPRSDGLYVEHISTANLTLYYTQTNGRLVARRYSVVVTPERLADPDSAAARLNAILNDTPRVASDYFSNWRSDHRLVNASVSMVQTANGEYSDTLLNSAGLEPLLQAVRADLNAGNLGRRYLLEDMERLNNCYRSDLNLTFYVPVGGIDTGVENPTVSYSEDTRTYTITITLQTTAQNTLPLLTEYGALAEGLHLMTHAQAQLENVHETQYRDDITLAQASEVEIAALEN